MMIEMFIISPLTSQPPAADMTMYTRTIIFLATAVDLGSFFNDVVPLASGWKNLTIAECLSIYDDPDKPLTTNRHVIMIVRNSWEGSTAGWNSTAGLYEMDWPISPLANVTNSLWATIRFERTDVSAAELQRMKHDYSSKDFGRIDRSKWITKRLRLNSTDNLITPNPKYFAPSEGPLKAMYCLSEPFTVPCELRVRNLTLLIEAFCLVKAIACLVALVLLRHHDPLITPGDTIESFIIDPDPTTENMCWASRGPERVEKWWWFWRRRSWVRGPRQWKAMKRRLGTAVPWYHWVFAYAWILFMLGNSTRTTVRWVLKWQP